MAKLKITKDQMKELEKQAKQFPTMPQINKVGDPLVKPYYFTGQELRRMVKKGEWNGPKIGDLSKLKPNQKYGPLLGFKNRNVLEELIKCMKVGGPLATVEYYQSYMKDYEMFLKRKLDNTKMDKDKNTNNETKNLSADGLDGGTVISMDSRPRTNSNTEGHGNIVPDAEQ